MSMSKSCKMLCSSSSNCRFINGHNSTIGVNNKMRSPISYMSNSRGCSISMTSSSMAMAISSISYNSLSSKVVSTCCNYSRFIGRNNSSIRMSYKVCVKVKRSTIASMSNCWESSISMATMTISSKSYYSQVVMYW